MLWRVIVNKCKVKMMGQDVRKRYIDLLKGALQRFYREDAADLFRGGPADERTMVDCIARYVWFDRQDDRYNGLLPHVNVEYNKMYLSDDESRVKAFGPVPACDKCSLKENCWERIKLQIEKKCEESLSCPFVDCKKHSYQFRPDLIVHKRNTLGRDGNGLVVEFKKEDADGHFDKSECDFDVAKILCCTCLKRAFRYKIGAFVRLVRDHAEIRVFEDRKECGAPIVVTA